MKQSVNYKSLKTKVGVDDIAYNWAIVSTARLVGEYTMKWFCLTHGSSGKLIIKNPKEKAAQTYFRRNGARGGDVVSLIRENIKSFHESAETSGR
jgi:hypothetical protein